MVHFKSSERVPLSHTQESPVWWSGHVRSTSPGQPVSASLAVSEASFGRQGEAHQEVETFKDLEDLEREQQEDG